MPYKSIEKKRVYAHAYREKNKEELNKNNKEYYQKNREELRRKNNVYNATHKELRAAYRDSHKEERAAYYIENKEELNKNNREYYQNHSEAVIQRTGRYHREHKEERQKWFKQYYQKIRLEVLAKVDPEMKCAMCGCDDPRFLEVNHIKGGGVKERDGYKKDGHDFGNNMILHIYYGRRGLEDLNLLCRACNGIDHLEREFGHTGLRIVLDKQVTK